MKKFQALLCMTLISLLVIACSSEHVATKPDTTQSVNKEFVTVNGQHFSRAAKPYYIAGANAWYAAYLGAPAAPGNRARLAVELDSLKAMGVNNLRVLAVSERSDINSAVKPATTNGFGNYDENLLQGLDYLLVEMAKRDMTAVLYLNNFWQWSGGMTQYMAWLEGSVVAEPNVTGDWEGFQAKSASFYVNAKAQLKYRATIKKLVTRTNTISGLAYLNDPTIMAWQLANEPRPGNAKSTDDEKRIYVNWIHDTASYIHKLDANHLVSSGSEGEMGSAGDMSLYLAAHSSPAIDYLTYHMWIRNWGWFDKQQPAATWDSAWAKAASYLDSHIEIARVLKKPLVLEEFGLDRDLGAYAITAPTEYRDKFFASVFEVITARAAKGEAIAGFNFWAWNGAARTQRSNFWWQQGDDFMGDPPQEEQGMYGVFDTDTSTINIIKSANHRLHKLQK
jgi:mannan endo-1,4-beta-mannosidase